MRGYTYLIGTGYDTYATVTHFCWYFRSAKVFVVNEERLNYIAIEWFYVPQSEGIPLLGMLYVCRRHHYCFE